MATIGLSKPYYATYSGPAADSPVIPAAVFWARLRS